MRLILIRHGQTSSNVTHALDTGDPGAPLTDLGHDQAAALVPALGHQPIEAMFTSQLTRARQTATPLAQQLGLDLQVRPGIREILAGDLEMRTDRESAMVYLQTVMQWTAGDLDLRIPGGETGHEFFARFDDAIAEVAASGAQTVAAVSHGAAIRSWVAVRAQNLAIERVADFPMHNTAAVVLDGSPSQGWEVLTWSGHTLGGEQLDDPQHAGPTAG